LALASSSAFAADGAAGKFWYEQNCARCHGSPPQERQGGTPNITGFGAERIRFALGNVVAMTKVSLNELQVLDVAAYLVRPVDFRWAPGIDFSDLWWNPAEPGWGVSVTQRPNSAVAGTLFIYQASGEPLWLVFADMRWLDPLTVSGQLFRSRARNFDPSFDPSSVMTRAAGTLRLQFTNRDSGIAEFTIDGVEYRKPISRVAF